MPRITRTLDEFSSTLSTSLHKRAATQYQAAFVPAEHRHQAASYDPHLRPARSQRLGRQHQSLLPYPHVPAPHPPPPALEADGFGLGPAGRAPAPDHHIKESYCAAMGAQVQPQLRDGARAKRFLRTNLPAVCLRHLTAAGCSDAGCPGRMERLQAGRVPQGA